MNRDECLRVMLLVNGDVPRCDLRIGWNEHGFTVFSANLYAKEDYRKALIYQPDLIISDLNGLEMISKLRNNYFECEYIILADTKDFECMEK